MNKLVLIAILTLAALALGAEDVTTETPSRLGPAVGVISTPLSAGYRLSMGGHYSFDIFAHVPEYVETDDGAAGFKFGALAGYNIPLRLEENLAFVIRPQLDVEFYSADIEGDTVEYDHTEFSVRPGAFLGVEVFMEEVGIENMNLAVGFTTGMDISSINTETPAGEDSRVTYHFPVTGAPFGATVGIWWYF